MGRHFFSLNNKSRHRSVEGRAFVCSELEYFEGRELLSGVAIYPQPAEVASAENAERSMLVVPLPVDSNNDISGDLAAGPTADSPPLNDALLVPQGRKSNKPPKVKFRIEVSNSADTTVTVKLETDSKYREWTVPKKSSKAINLRLDVEPFHYNPEDGPEYDGFHGEIKVLVYVGSSEAIQGIFFHNTGVPNLPPRTNNYDMTQYQIDFAALPEGGWVWNVNHLS